MTMVDYFVVAALATASLLLGVTLHWAYSTGVSKPRLALMVLVWCAALLAVLLGLGRT